MAEQRQITIVVGLITNEQGEIFLTKRDEPGNAAAHGKWEFPGGGVDFGEDPLEALKREVREETGFEVEPLRLLSRVYTNIWDNSFQVLIIAYECKILSGAFKAMDPEILSDRPSPYPYLLQRLHPYGAGKLPSC